MSTKNDARIAAIAIALSTSVIATAASAQEDELAARPFETDLREVFPRAGGLTSTDVARRTLSRSPNVASQRAEVAAAVAGVDRALVAFFPKLTLSGRYTRVSDESSSGFGNLLTAPGAGEGPVPAGTQLVNVKTALPSILNQWAFEASLSVPISDYLLRTSQSYAAASHSARSAEMTLRATELQAGAEARIAYYELARARLQRLVAKRGLAQTDAHLADVKRLFDAGSASKADVMRVEAQVASSRLLLEKSEGLVVVTERRLRTMMGDATPRRYEIGEDLDRDVDTGKATRAELEAEALRRRPEIRALDHTAWALDQQADVARAAYLPRLDAFGSLVYANPNSRQFPQEKEFSSSWSAGLAVTFVINDAAAAGSATREVESRALAVREQKRALQDALQDEVTSAHQGVIDARAAIRSTADGLAAAEESWRARRALFRVGRATSVELVDAETELLRARLEAIHARVDLRVAAVRIARATGRDAR